MAFDMLSKEATVTYDPKQVSAKVVREVIRTADSRAQSDDDSAGDVGLLLGEEQREQRS